MFRAEAEQRSDRLSGGSTPSDGTFLVPDDGGAARIGPIERPAPPLRLRTEHLTFHR